MRRKFTMLLASVCLCVGTAWAQTYQKVPHVQWTVTAQNQAGTSGNEGGVDFVKDENPMTFYHSKWGGDNEGANGSQGFLVNMGAVYNISKITYTGRSDNANNWATKVRIYVYETLPDGFTELSSLTVGEKNTLFANNEVLGTPAFNNNEEGTWEANRNMKTAEFAEAKSGQYILFIADETTGNNGFFTCSDFHVWQKVEGIVEDKPYFLKITNIAGGGDWYLDTNTPIDDTSSKTTIGKSQTAVATYFTLNDGYWHISSIPGNVGSFISVDKWCATPQSATAANWTIENNGDGSISLIQNVYGTGSNRYLGGNQIITGDGDNSSKVYTDAAKENALKLQLVELDELATAKENAKVLLAKTGVGYPVADSEARTTLLEAMTAAEATAESINAAIATYQADANVVLPEAGKVYRLISAISAFKPRKALYSANNELRWQSLDANATNQLWTIQNISETNMTMMNVNDAMYPQKSDFSTAIKMLPVENEGSINFLGKGQFRVAMNKEQGIHANGHLSGTGNAGNTINYNTGADNASAWYFEEVVVTKEILAAQINSLKAEYLGSLLVKQESVADLQAAVETAQAIHDANGDYATAFATLVAAVNAADIEYIDLGYFYMKSKGAQKYAYNDYDALKVADEKSPKSIFKLTKANNGTFYVQNANGLYAQNVSTSTLVKTASSKLEYTVTRLASGYYALRPTSNTNDHGFWHDANNGTGNIVGWNTTADNTQWTFEELSVEEAAKIYTVSDMAASEGVYVSYGGTYDGDKDVRQEGGFYVLDGAPTVSDFTVQGSVQGSSSQVLVSGNDITVVEGISGDNVYILRCKKGNAYARYHGSSQLNANDATNMLTYEGNLHWESLFYIDEGEGEYADYYTIRPIVNPTMYAYNLETVDADSKVAMKEAPTEGDLTANYYWKISSFGEQPGNITPHGGDTYGWNKRGSYNGYSHIGYWNGHNSADDNTWFVRIVEDELIPLHTLDNSVIGYATYESVEESLPYAQILSPAGLAKLKNAKFDYVMPIIGKFYRFSYDYGDAGVKYIQAVASGVSGKANAMLMTEEQGAASIFYYADNKLLSYSAGLYVNDKDENRGLQAVGDVAGAVSFATSTVAGKLYIYAGGSFHANKDGDVCFVDHCGTPHTPEHNFTVTEVTTLPVTIGTIGYATLHAPVALSIPENVKVYTGTLNGEWLTLEEVSTTIPANTPVILEATETLAEATVFEFPVVSDVTAISENALSGTTAAEATSGTLYTLQSNGDGGVVFKKYTGTNLGGFRAHLVLPETTAAQAIRIRKGNEVNGDGGTTGIDGSVLDAQDSQHIYDLMGRKVTTMKQGGIYIVNGKKVVK